MASDLRYAVRSLGKSPLFSLVVVLTLALGIGANTAIFSVVHAVLLSRTPIRDIDRVAMVWETDRNTATTREPGSLPDFDDLRARVRSFATIAAMIPDELNLTPAHGDPRRVAAMHVTSDLLPMLGLSPSSGRLLTADEARPGGARSIVISEALWEREFNRAPDALGRTLTIDDQAWTVVGIMPHGADFGVLQVLSSAAYGRGFADRGERTEVSVWIPLQFDARQLPRSTHPLFFLGRLAPNASVGVAAQEAEAVMADLERAYPENAARGAHVEPLADVVTGKVRPAMLVLLGAVALVLLVAAVNVASLLLARGAARSREIAVRRALGASAGRLAQLFLAESVLLTGVAAAAGIAAAYLGVRILIALAPSDIPRIADAGVSLPVLGLTVTVSVIVAIAFGFVPMLQARRVDVQPALQSGMTRTTAGRDARRVREALVVAEIALAMVLVCGAGPLVRSFWSLTHLDAGFHTGGVLKAEYQLPSSRYPVDFRRWPDFSEQHRFTRDVLARAAVLPGVVSVAITGNHPLDPGSTNSFTIVGRESESRSWPEITIRRVTPGYFATVGLALRQGRTLTDGDATTATPVAVINEAAVRRFFKDRDPLGASMRFWGASRRIVGIVADEKFQGLDAESPIAVYTPLAQTPSAGGAGVLLVRTQSDPAALTADMRRVIRDVDGGLAIFGVEPLDDTLARSLSQRRFTLALMFSFAVVGLSLAALGVYGILSYTVARRRQEIGIRLAMGAAAGTVTRMFVREALVIAVIGVACGLAGAFVLTRSLRALLFGVSATDPATFVIVPVLLVAVALAAAAVPALRASRVDPLVVLRSE